jgi:Fur family transcriptional regulator, ferric uptake regulator
MQNILNKLESYCSINNIKLTPQRRLIAQTIGKNKNHPDIDELYQQIHKIDSSIGIATLYRTLKILEEADIIEKHYFANNTNPRYEQIIEDSHHDHLVDITSGEVIEFFDQKLEDLKTEIAKKLGYELIDHRLDLYGKKLKTNNVK